MVKLLDIAPSAPNALQCNAKRWPCVFGFSRAENIEATKTGTANFPGAKSVNLMPCI
jgi:hypothetical protein